MVQPPPDGEAAEAALAHGLQPVGARPPLPAYLRALWQRRSFIWAFARARVDATYTRSQLGRAWNFLTPLMNAGVYYLIFGLLLQTSRGIENFIAYLVCGVFVMGYSQRSIRSGSVAITGNLGLVRSLHFPRAVLPVAAVTEQFLGFLASLTILIPVILLTGEPITWAWLLFPVAIALQTLFTTGAALTFARLGAQAADLNQILPFALRVWLYGSGVFYSFDRFQGVLPDWALVILTYQPGAVYLQLARDALMTSYTVPVSVWWAGVAWGVVALVGGTVYFWRAEAFYGRV
ncbi:MAG: ABC transporter permease [Actinomycetales bacterium]|nr:ABC transporter permease [Actinomycetales bacterium]